jgi:hypothetical protein
MLIGSQSSFAIDCYCDSPHNDTRWVIGRMCVWIDGKRLGDITETSCVLNVTAGQLDELLRRIDSLDDPALVNLDDRATYDLLDLALYVDDELSDEKVTADEKRFAKFDFLTNGRESFDRSKSFITNDANGLRIMFTNENDEFFVGRVSRSELFHVVTGYLGWVSNASRHIE